MLSVHFPSTPTPVRATLLARALKLAVGLAIGLACARDSLRAAEEREQNLWPVVVRHYDAAGRIDSWTAAGPLIFRKPDAGGGTVSGFRPFWVQTHNEQ